MGLRHSVIFERIEQLVASGDSASTCMGEIIDICSRDVPHADWSRLSTLDYDSDVKSLSNWIAGVFERSPAPFPIQGLWFGLCNPTEGDNVWADMYVGALGQYAPDDEELNWLFGSKLHYPNNAYANSTSLRSIYEIAYSGTGGLGNDAEWPLCLAFSVISVRSLLRGRSTDLVGSSAPRIGVVVGFDDGDLLKIGELTVNGFVTI